VRQRASLFVKVHCGLDSKILTLTCLRAKCDEKLYRLNLALILIGQFMWAEQIKSYNGNIYYSKKIFASEKLAELATTLI
jgi:uncharacterized membrane protein YoaT (DUF817 family)